MTKVYMVLINCGFGGIKYFQEKETIWKIWYRDENGKIQTCIRSDYDLKRTRDIHSRIITMIKWK